MSYNEIGKKFGCCLAAAREIILGHRKNYPLDPAQHNEFKDAPHRTNARFSENDIKEMQRLRITGLSYPEIAAIFGCHKGTIQKILGGRCKTYNLENLTGTTPCLTGRALKFTIADAQQMRQFRRDGLSYDEIGKRFATTGGTARDIITGKIKSYPLSSNDTDFQRKPVTSVEEIARMRELREQGMQYKQIAALFGCSDSHVRFLLQGKYKRRSVS